MRKSKPVNMTNLLKQVNAIRVAFGNEEIQEMRPGRVSNPLQCPIAMSLANGWEPDVADEIVMRPSKSLTLEKGIEICKRLTAQGFSHVRLFSGAMRLYPRLSANTNDISWAKPDAIHIPLTQTMNNFIDRFDNGEFEQLVKGRNGNSVL